MKKTQKRKEIQRRKTKWRTLSKITLDDKTRNNIGFLTSTRKASVFGTKISR
jgi:hypothetical protein